MTQILKTALLTTFALGFAGSATAQVVVLGNGAAARCYQDAKMGNPGTRNAIRNCTEALDTNLRKKDEAATYVNRGVLQMRKGKYAESRLDYESAIALKPELDQAYINYGAALFYLGEQDAAMTALNAAMDMGTEKMPEALYNRALVYHEKQDYTSAYKDLKQALAMRPEWEPALNAISRYDVKTRS